MKIFSLPGPEVGQGSSDLTVAAAAWSLLVAAGLFRNKEEYCDCSLGVKIFLIFGKTFKYFLLHSPGGCSRTGVGCKILN